MEITVQFANENTVDSEYPHVNSATFSCVICARDFVRMIDASEKFIVVAPMPKELER